MKNKKDNIYEDFITGKDWIEFRKFFVENPEVRQFTFKLIANKYGYLFAQEFIKYIGSNNEIPDKFFADDIYFSKPEIFCDAWSNLFDLEGREWGDHILVVQDAVMTLWSVYCVTLENRKIIKEEYNPKEKENSETIN